jgi:hypothetical protein
MIALSLADLSSPQRVPSSDEIGHEERYDQSDDGDSEIAVLVLTRKLLPAKAAIDVPLALAIVGLGILTVIAPSSVPGLTPPM